VGVETGRRMSGRPARRRTPDQGWPKGGRGGYLQRAFEKEPSSNSTPGFANRRRGRARRVVRFLEARQASEGKYAGITRRSFIRICMHEKMFRRGLGSGAETRSVGGLEGRARQDSEATHPGEALEFMLNASSISSAAAAVTRKRKLVARMATLPAGRQCYVFRSKCDRSAEQLLSCWSESMGAPRRRVHRHICRSSRASV